MTISGECFYETHNQCGGFDWLTAPCDCVCHKSHALLLDFLADYQRQEKLLMRAWELAGFRWPVYLNNIPSSGRPSPQAGLGGSRSRLGSVPALHILVGKP
jgi:hypothetical protein